jgi:hypothetical protein
MLPACGDARRPADPGDTSLAKASTVDTGMEATDSTAAAAKRAADSIMQAPPPPLAPVADAAIGADSIPLIGPNGEQTRYGLASGKIVQRFTGNRRGQRIIIFDQYGMRERREENVMPYPENHRGTLHNIIVITTPEMRAYAEVRSKQGSSKPNESLKQYLDRGAGKTVSLAELILQSSGAERLGDTVIAGYHCRVLRKETPAGLVTNYVWRGIVLREHVVSPKDSIEFTTETVSIEPNITVPASTFEFGAGYTITPERPRPTPPGIKQ